MLIIEALLGGAGGLLRSIVGLTKALRQEKIPNPFYFLTTTLLAVIIGAVVGILFAGLDKRIIFLSGYAGTDLLESLTKIIKKKAYGVFS